MLGASDMLRRCMPLSFISISFMDGLRCERVLDTVEGNWLVGASGTVTISGIVVVFPNACWVSGAGSTVVRYTDSCSFGAVAFDRSSLY